MDDNCKLLILFFPFYLLHNSAFQPVSSSSIKQKINPMITFQLTISYEEKKCSKNIHICVSDAAVYVTISSSPLKQFIQSKLHVITPAIPVVVSNNQPRLEYLPGKYMKIGEVVLELKSTVKERKMFKRTLVKVWEIYLVPKDFSRSCLVQRRLREELIMDYKHPSWKKIFMSGGYINWQSEKTRPTAENWSLKTIVLVIIFRFTKWRLYSREADYQRTN